MPTHSVPTGTTAGVGLAELAERSGGSSAVPAALRAHIGSSDDRKRGNFSSFIAPGV
ncbi:hypothetical protein [Nocardia sp. NPDC003345]